MQLIKTFGTATICAVGILYLMLLCGCGKNYDSAIATRDDIRAEVYELFEGKRQSRLYRDAAHDMKITNLYPYPKQPSGSQKFQFTLTSPTYVATVEATVNRHGEIRDTKVTDIQTRTAQPEDDRIQQHPSSSWQESLRTAERQRADSEIAQEKQRLQNETAQERFKLQNELRFLHRRIEDVFDRIGRYREGDMSIHAFAMKDKALFREVLLYLAKNAGTDEQFARYQSLGKELGLEFTQEEAQNHDYRILKEFSPQFQE